MESTGVPKDPRKRPGASATGRRAVFTGLGAAGLIHAAWPARAQTAKPLVIGVLNDSSGPTSDVTGVGGVVSAELALEDFGGTVLGRPIQLLKGNHQAKPDLGTSIARQWYDDGVTAIFDVGISTIAIGVQQLAREKDRIVVFNSSGSLDLTGKFCSPNGIVWTYDAFSVAVGAAKANMEGGRKTWFFLTVDYTYGDSLQSEATKYIEAQDGKVLGATRHPFGTKDFSSDLLTASYSKAEIIGLATTTVQSKYIIKQAAEFGLLKGSARIAPFGLFFNDVKAIGLDTAQGLLVTEPFYWNQTDDTRRFSKRYLDRVGAMPNSLQASVYGGVMHYLRAVEAAGSDDTATVLRAMKAAPVNDFMTANGIIRADGRLLRDVFVFRVKAPQQSVGEWDLFEAVSTIQGVQAFKAADPSTCALL